MNTTTKLLYAEVAPAVPLPVTSARTYTYSVPEGLVDQVKLYMPVTVPFGPRQIPGLIVELHSRRVPYKTKSLAIALPVALTPGQVQFGQWLSQTMQGGLGYTLRLFLPPNRKSGWLEPGPVKRFAPRGATRRSILIEPNFKKRTQAVWEQAKDHLKAGRSVVIIVPEVWLLDRWNDTVPSSLKKLTGLVQAALSPKQHQEIWQQVERGEVKIIIGTQKALFLPFQKLGLIVIDEEYLTTHKLWDQYPRLDNRLGALALAQIHQADHLVASSVPSLRLKYLADKEGWSVTQLEAPELKSKIVTATFEDRAQKRLLPDEVVYQLKTWLKKKQRVLILHNARGGWQTLYCKSCETPVRCPNCHVALTIHGTGGKAQLMCHHCGYIEKELPKTCPTCKKGELMTFGAGMERVSDVLSTILPSRTSITTFDAKAEALSPEALAKGEQIIIATSAVFSRLPDVKFDQAIYLWPERGLLYPDFRSEERTLYQVMRLQQLLPKAHKVVLVTRQPRLLQIGLGTSWSNWETRQLNERQKLQYPPFTDLIRLTVQDKDEKKAKSKAMIIRKQLDDRQKAQNITANIRGPFSSFLTHRRGLAEVHLLLTGKLSELTSLYTGLAVNIVDVSPERIL